MSNYDAWLTKPYDDQADEEWMCESYEATTRYEDNRDEWLSENAGKTEDDFRETDHYYNCARRWASGE
jgi:hypothetical protein